MIVPGVLLKEVSVKGLSAVTDQDLQKLELMRGQFYLRSVACCLARDQVE